MSYEKHVYPRYVPSDVMPLWAAVMARFGLDVQFHPAFTLTSWGGGYVPCRLVVREGAFETAERYGTVALSAGFEFDATIDPAEKALVIADYVREMKDDGTPLPRALVRTLRASPAILAFTHGGFSWTTAEFRVCWFAAAALAEVTGGLLFDEWHGGQGPAYVDGRTALRNAAERSLEFELSPDRPPDSWDIPPFHGWEP